MRPKIKNAKKKSGDPVEYPLRPISVKQYYNTPISTGVICSSSVVITSVTVVLTKGNCKAGFREDRLRTSKLIKVVTLNKIRKDIALYNIERREIWNLLVCSNKTLRLHF